MRENAFSHPVFIEIGIAIGFLSGSQPIPPQQAVQNRKFKTGGNVGVVLKSDFDSDFDWDVEGSISPLANFRKRPYPELVAERKPSFSPISASGSNFNPQNTLSIPAVKIFAVLDLDEKSWFSFGH